MFSEFRSATRGLRRWRGSAIAVLTLAVGIGMTTGLAALARALMADVASVPDLERVARVYAASQALGVERSPVALHEFDTVLSAAGSFQAIGGYADEDAVIGRGLEARPVVAGYASPGFFAAMAVPPAAGRALGPGDLSGPPVVVVSDALWRRELPGGRLGAATLVVDGVERAVVGVMPPAFHYPFVGVSADLWIPLARASREMPPIVNVYARLRDGVEWPAAQAELTGLARGGTNGQWTWRAIPIARDASTRATAAYATTLGPAALVLIIACVNVACLLLGRGVARERELSVRRALGASRGRVVALLVTEHAMLAAAGGTLGVAFAYGMLRVIGSRLAAVDPALAASLTADARLLPTAFVTTAVACLIVAAVPALRQSRGNVVASLNGVPSAHRFPMAGYGARDVIVFAEVAVAIGFVVWTAMLYALFAQFDAIKVAFPADHVVAMRVPAPLVNDVAARVAAVPGVARTAISSGTLGGGALERAELGDGRMAVVSRVPVGGGFLDTLGVPLVRGRAFDANELAARAGVAIVSESAARRLAPDRDVLGLRFRLPARGDVVVIGVSRDAIDHGALATVEAAAAEIYVPYEPSAKFSAAVVLARTDGDAHAALQAVAAAAQLPPGSKPVRPVVLSDDFSHRDSGGGAVVARMLAAFAILTLLLAASGVFAVVSQSVTERTREFGIRLAIGATPSGVLRTVLAREGKLIVAAAVTGVAFTMLGTGALFTELVEINAIVPSTWLEALLLSAGVAAFAVACATLRIVRLEPAAVLRRT